jgi:glycosyltransferase involved in cell wall biosynthesis
VSAELGNGPTRVGEADAGSVSVVLAIPAYNEAANLQALLDSAARAQLPAGAVWTEWVILDGGSIDTTVETAQTWSRSHPQVRLRVDTNPTRKGKATDLARMHCGTRRRSGVESIVVVVDGDVRIDPGSLEALLEPMFVDPTLAAVWGTDRCALRGWGRLASSFQMELGRRIQKIGGLEGAPAYGRFFADRVSAFKEFTWKAGFVADDIQFAAYVKNRGLRGRSVPEATVAVIPAHGWRDFCLQTRRFYVSVSKARTAGIERVERRPPLALLTTLVRTTVSYPFGALAYLVARVVEILTSTRTASAMSDAWPVSTSTKEFSPL